MSSLYTHRRTEASLLRTDGVIRSSELCRSPWRQFLERTTVLWSLLALCCLYSIAFSSSAAYADAHYGTLPSFEGLDSSDQAIDENFLKGNVGLINFFFTSCQGPCPILMEKLRVMISKVDCESARFLSISVDPETDTPALLAEYKEKHGIQDNRWKLAALSQEQLEKLLVQDLKLGQGQDIASHTTRFVLVEPNGEIAKPYRQDQLKELEEELLRLCAGR